MTQTVTLKNVRENLSDLVSRVAFGEQKVVITRFGKPAAAIVSYRDFKLLMNPRRRFSKKKWEVGFKLIDKMRKNTQKYSVKEVNRAIEQAIIDVRKVKRVSRSS